MHQISSSTLYFACLHALHFMPLRGLKKEKYATIKDGMRKGIQSHQLSSNNTLILSTCMAFSYFCRYLQEKRSFETPLIPI